MNRFICLVVFIVACAGCGHGYPYMIDEGESSISLMEILISRTQVKVGMPVQMSVAVTLNSGEKIDGLTTSFEIPDTLEMQPIEWSVSDRTVATVDEGARLIPIKAGFVIVHADLMSNVRSRTVRVDESVAPDESVVPSETMPSSSDDEDEGGGDGHSPSDESDNSDESEEELPSVHKCQGHAESVASFSPGTGAGFGMSSYPDIVLGPPQGAGGLRGSTHVLSLGTHGEIVLDLGTCALADDEGIDLIVFENPFLIGGDPNRPYAELGVVGVSEDGVNYLEFPCDDSGFPYTGCAGWNPVYSSPSNGISPFDVVNAGGDRFDLEDIGVAKARYVRIRDLNGRGGGGTAGFDLDAISVVNGVEDD